MLSIAKQIKQDLHSGTGNCIGCGDGISWASGNGSGSGTGDASLYGAGS